VDLTLVQTFIEMLATVAFALSGLLEAARKKLDAARLVVMGFAGDLYSFNVLLARPTL